MVKQVAKSGLADVKAKLIIKDMARWKITPSPQNYHVWYEYISGNNPELTEAVEAFIASDEGFPDQVVNDLYQQYVADERVSKDLKRAQLATQTVLKDVLGELLTAGSVTAEYQLKLEQYSKSLVAAPSSAEFQQVIGELLADTTEMQQASLQLLKNLEETRSRAELLQRQLRKIEEEGLIDNLTGLGNRKAALEKLQEIRQISVESEQNFSIFVMEIDCFDKFHDIHGRDIGDAVLRRIAAAIKDNLKGRDFPARIADDKFLGVLPATPLDSAVVIANMLREALLGMRLQVTQSDVDIGSVTASFGVVQFDLEDSVEGLLERVEMALSAALRLGGNAVATDRDF